MNFWRCELDEFCDKSEEHYNAAGSDEEEKENSPTPFLNGKQFDLQAYASNYRRRMKILRLVFIADRFGYSNEHRRRPQLDALRIAYDRAKKGKDVNLFAKIVEKIRGGLGPNYTMDQKWCNKVNQNRHKMNDMMQRWAKQCEDSYAEDNISADSARIAFNYIANFYHVHGALTTAYGFYRMSSRFCRSDKDHSEMLLRVIVVAVELGQFEIVATIAEKGLAKAKLNPITTASLRCALGLARFRAQRYKDAAHQFLGVSKELGNRFSEVLAAHDIAIYGGLCALATFEPSEFQTLVMDNENFQFYLDSAIEVKELINNFDSRHFDNLRKWLLVEMYLFDRFETLYEQIRNKALIHYTEPFTAVGLQRVAVVFGTNIEAIEKELTALINTNQIQADIDPINKVLRARKV